MNKAWFAFLLVALLANIGTASELNLPAPAFRLTDQTGETFDSANLKGKTWVVHFFYTTCTGGCTKTAPTMARLQELIRGKPRLALVSISLNDDAPEVLKRYAEDLKADPGQWHFLTGDRESIRALVQEGFKQSVVANKDAPPGQEIGHSFSLMVVDPEGQLRGYEDGLDAGSAGRLYRRMYPEAVLFPAINAVLNFQCGVLLLLGWLAIKQRRETLHKICMLAALAVSGVFLTSYLYYHFAILNAQPTRFQGEGAVRFVYFGILLTHTILAAVVAPAALYLAYLGLRDSRPRHVKLARWTMPVWLYVSVTGVVVYFMLYHLYPAF